MCMGSGSALAVAAVERQSVLIIDDRREMRMVMRAKARAFGDANHFFESVAKALEVSRLNSRRPFGAATDHKV